MIKCVPPYCVPPSNSKAIVNFTVLIGSLSSLKNIKHGLTVKDFVMIKTTVFLPVLCVSALAHNPRSPVAKSWSYGEIIDTMEF